MKEHVVRKYNDLCDRVVKSIDKKSIPTAIALLDCYNSKPLGYPYIDFCFFYKQLKESGESKSLCGIGTSIKCPLFSSCAHIQTSLQKNDIGIAYSVLDKIRTDILDNHNSYVKITVDTINTVKMTLLVVVAACHEAIEQIEKSLPQTTIFIPTDNALKNLRLCSMYDDTCGGANPNEITCPLHNDDLCDKIKKRLEDPNYYAEGISILLTKLKRFIADWDVKLAPKQLPEKRLLVTPVFIPKKRPKNVYMPKSGKKEKVLQKMEKMLTSLPIDEQDGLGHFISEQEAEKMEEEMDTSNS